MKYDIIYLSKEIERKTFNVNTNLMTTESIQNFINLHEYKKKYVHFQLESIFKIDFYGINYHKIIHNSLTHARATEGVENHYVFKNLFTG